MTDVRNRICTACADTFLTTEETERCPKCERDDLRAQLFAYEQTSGELCPACGWRGIRGDDPCAFCSLASNAEKTRADAAEAKLAACERERDEVRSPQRCPFGETRECAREACEERLRMKLDRNDALSEAERLREALMEIERIDNDTRQCAGYVCQMARLARAALSTPATPAAPSSAAPTVAEAARAHNRADGVPGVPASLADDTMSPYRRGYERAVEACAQVANYDPVCRGLASDEPLCQHSDELVSAIRALLPAPEREGTEAEVERIANLIARIVFGNGFDDDDDAPLDLDGRQEAACDEAARAVLAEMGRGGK